MMAVLEKIQYRKYTRFKRSHHKPRLGNFRVRFLKTFLDFWLSLILLIVLSPLIAIVSLLIVLDSPGVPFIVQKRTGFGNRPFRMFKFRTMEPNAHELRKNMQTLNEVDGSLFKIKSDPRMTRLGKYLRRYSVDEIPQLINVLLGDMSLVGPRPLLLEELEQHSFSNSFYHHWQVVRHQVKPGMTGLWQVNGRNDLPFYEMVRLDLQYVDHWSPIMDLKIFLKTPLIVLRHVGAY